MVTVAIVGGGPTGLMAAEAAVVGGVEVALYDAMPSVGRKFLLAGKGGLNLTHSEPMEQLLSRYGTRRPDIEPAIQSFPPEAIRAWAHSLNIETFVGSSGRVFPTDLKAAPLLRAWLRRLRTDGVQFHVRHRWVGWDQDGRLLFTTPGGLVHVGAHAVVLALGGGSWPQLGSDADWVRILNERSVSIAPLKPANCGFDVRWSEYFRTTFSGHPVKTVQLTTKALDGTVVRQMGEFVITANGVEGGVIYMLSASLRDAIAAEGAATLWIDLAPDRSLKRLSQDLSRPRGKRTLATHLKRCAGIAGVKAGLLREAVPKEVFFDPVRLATILKALPVTLRSPRPLEEAISTAGGVSFEGVNTRLMLRSRPGVFCAGEMLDWEAPTGGYLLTGCLATGRLAGTAAAEWGMRK
ncbi:MAG: TIGR03862 family flavoprotein [Nitrospira sp.]|nr:TIGR03862 family flavoprotein [Nitrospira sp.]